MSTDFLEKDVVYISSSNRLNGTSNDFNIDLSDQIKSPNNYDTVTLLSASIHKSYYLINSSNNLFNVIENTNTTSITLPNGNYSVSSLVNQLNTSWTVCSWTYTVSINISTGKLTFSVKNNTAQPSFDLTVSNLGLVIGFDLEVYAFTNNVLTSVNVVNFQLTNTIELMSDIVEKSTLSVIIPDNTDFSVIT